MMSSFVDAIVSSSSSGTAFAPVELHPIRMQTEAERLRDELQTLKQQNNDLHLSIQDYMAKEFEQSVKLNDYQVHIKNMESIVQQLRVQYSDLLDDSESRNEISTLQTEAEKLRDELQTLRLQNDNLQSSIKDYTAKENENSTKLRDKDLQIKNLESTLKELHIENGSLRDTSELRNTISRQEIEAEQLRNEIGKLTEQNQDLQSSLKDYTAKDQENSTALTKYELHVKDLEFKLKELEIENGGLRDTSELRNTISRLEKSKESNRHRKKKIEALEGIVKEREEKLQELNGLIEQLNQQNANLQAQLSLQDTDLQELRAIQDQLNQRKLTPKDVGALLDLAKFRHQEIHFLRSSPPKIDKCFEGQVAWIEKWDYRFIRTQSSHDEGFIKIRVIALVDIGFRSLLVKVPANVTDVSAMIMTFREQGLAGGGKLYVVSHKGAHGSVVYRELPYGSTDALALIRVHEQKETLGIFFLRSDQLPNFWTSLTKWWSLIKPIEISAGDKRDGEIKKAGDEPSLRPRDEFTMDIDGAEAESDTPEQDNAKRRR